VSKTQNRQKDGRQKIKTHEAEPSFFAAHFFAKTKMGEVELLPAVNMPRSGLKTSTVSERCVSKVAISLREMSLPHGKQSDSRSPGMVDVGDSISLISAERDGHFASPDRRWQVLKHGLVVHSSRADG